MPHGTPDWGLVGPKQTVYGLDDIGEGVARLGSPVLWDRRGDVIKVVDFRHGLQGGNTTAVGGTTAVDLYTGYARYGAYSIQVFCDDVANAEASWGFYCPYSIGGAFGFEVSFALIQLTQTLILSGTVYADADAWEYYIEIRPEDQEIWYRHATLGVVILGDTPKFHNEAYWWNTLKVVIDTAMHSYERCLLNGRTYPIRGLPMRHIGGGGFESIGIGVGVMGSGDHEEYTYFDGIILTQNEPV